MIITVRVCINGMGRMGRLALRTGWGNENLEFVHVNEVTGGAETSAHLLVFDSVHGKWDIPAKAENGKLHVGGRPLGLSAVEKPGNIDWGAMGIDIVLECSCIPLVTNGNAS